jgi:Amt family ammonium transporter
VAERIKFKGYVLFVLLWVTVVYFPLCHMVWGKGGYFNWALGGKIPVLGFCRGHRGSHQLGRLGAGLRHHAGQTAMAIRMNDDAAQRGAVAHRHGAAVGGLVWLQRRQRAERRQSLATSAFAATHFSAAAAALSWATVEWWH